MMRSIRAWRLWAAAMALATSSGVQAAPEDTLKEIQAQIDALKKQNQYTVNSGSLVIESWLLSSSAIDSTAGKIQTAVQPYKNAAPARSILVVAGNEALDFGQVAMLQLEIEALTQRLMDACQCSQQEAVAAAIPAFAGAIAGLLKSETELTAIEQTVDAKLLAAAVAAKLSAILPSAAVAAGTGGTLVTSFGVLVSVANDVQKERDALARIEKPTDFQKDKLARLTALLARYDTFYTRVTTPNATGVVPLAAAARLQSLTVNNPYVLHVNTEKAGGTLVKRTNVLTALGAESVFITGGLVSSYQLTEPTTGAVLVAGIVTCRTTLTTLKRVQSASWKGQASTRTTTGRTEPAAICSP